jgi:hypothetical protein
VVVRTELKVYPNYTGNTEFYEDQPMVFLVDADAMTTFTTGSMMSFVGLNNTDDVNILNPSKIQNGLNNYSVTGTTTSSGSTTLNISYANPDGGGTITKTFNINQLLYNGVASYSFPSDIEYHQVITATTVGEHTKYC